MAKENKEPKTVLEKTYNVPLRREYMKAPRWKRTPRAVKALREFITKHMKSSDVKIGKYANKELWKNGMKNPPHHIKVNATKDEEDLVIVELVGAPKEEPKEKKESGKPKEEKKEIKGEEEKIEKIEDRLNGKKEDRVEKAKEIERKEIKELKRERPKEHPQKQESVPKKVEQQPTAPMGR